MKLPIPKNSMKDSLTSNDFQVKCSVHDDEVDELLIFGEIGSDFGVGATEVVNFLANSDKKIRVRINSPGGLAFDGIAIFNALKDREGEVEVVLEGLAASSGAIIAMAGDTIRMQENATLFIHRAHGVAIGNAADLRDQAEFLDVLDNGIAATMAARTGLDHDDVMELLIGEVDGTTLGAEAAKSLGFIDEIITLKPKKVGEKARKQLNNFLKIEAKAQFDAKFKQLKRPVNIDIEREGAD